MSFSFSSLIRLLVLLAIGSTMVAVGLARLDPTRTHWRFLKPTKYSNVSEYFLDVTDRTPRWLDAESGRVEPFPISDDDVLETASCAPWANEQGQTQAVGRWSSRTKDGPMSMSNDFGLARYTFPGGEMIDHVSTEIVPVTPPCWFPGTRARVLFAGGDGVLYHFAFESDRGPGSSAPPIKAADDHPGTIAWKCKQPGDGSVFISDVTWPEDPKMRGALVVSLRQQVTMPTGSKAFSRTQLWWLKLNNAGTQIVDAGRLVRTDPDGSHGEEVDERSPSVATRPDGSLMLAYLGQRPGQKGWDLRVAPIAIEQDRKVPVVLESEAKLLGEQCLPARPSFSPDGRWVNVIVGPSSIESKVARHSTAGL